MPYNYGPRCRREMADRIADDIAFRLAQPFNPRVYRAQLTAGGLHNCLNRLPDLRAPALIVHGEEDRVLPVGNAHLMAAGIPGAELQVLEGVGHLYPTEAPAVDEHIGEFLSAVPD